MKEALSIDEAPAQTVLSVLNKYHYFTSIEPTSKSEELGLYLFLSTSKHFDQDKRIITDTLPKMWAKLENNVHNELSATVRCPRLTTSNLKDDFMTKTAKMLAVAEIPNTDTDKSKWSRAPKIHKPPTRAVIVNSEQHFPPSKAKRRRMPNRWTTP
jgi:hypothetical protein